MAPLRYGLRQILRAIVSHGILYFSLTHDLSLSVSLCLSPDTYVVAQAFSSMKESSRRLLGGEPEEKTALQEMEEAVCSVCPQLSWRNRLIGYGACLALGFFLTFGSMFRLDQSCTYRTSPAPPCSQLWILLR